MSKTLATISFADLLPPSIATDERFQAAALVLDQEMASDRADINRLLLWSRLDELQEPLLSTLAWELHVDYWKDTWPEEIKRQALKRAYILHRHKGTPGAVEAAVADAVGSGTVTEWYEYAGSPGYFKVAVELTTSGLDAETWDDMSALITQYKNTRSWLEKLDVYLTGHAPVTLAAAFIGGETITVYPYSLTELEQLMPMTLAIGYQSVETITVYPQT